VVQGVLAFGSRIDDGVEVVEASQAVDCRDGRQCHVIFPAAAVFFFDSKGMG
jgi:hypothetical protein